MVGKASRISELWDGIDPRGRDVRYAAYFHHFNREDYYEAHDVLESLWLEEGRQAQGAAFYQGLIQLAGAFVHMRKHFEHPGHRVHQQRLAPAYRLLGLAEKNLAGYGEEWEGIRLEVISELAKEIKSVLSSGEFQTNPWSPKQGPRLELPKKPN
jgi:predicted metal-dependent hydrolase